MGASLTTNPDQRYAINPVADAAATFDAQTNSNTVKLGAGDWQIESVAVLATGTEINRACDTSTRIVDVTTSTLAVTEALHDGKTLVCNRAAGIAFTLPAATGSGTRLRIVVGTAFTGDATIKVTGNDTMVGLVLGLDGDGVPANAWTVGGTDDTITMDGSATPNMTQGGFAGDFYELEDIKTDLWLVRGFIKQTGTEATPMSATV